VRRVRLEKRGNGAAPADEPQAWSNTGYSDEAFAANGRNGHATAPLLLRLLSVRARTTARPSQRALTRRRLLHVSSWEDLQREIDRSRRYGHSFSVVRLTSRATSKPVSDRQHEQRRAELEQRALTLSVLLRRLDLVWPDGEDVYVLLPEGGRAMAESMLDRIGESLTLLMPGWEAAIAAFPDDGVSKGALLAALGSASARPDPPPVEVNDVPARLTTPDPENPAPHAAG
jgi:hypothetical protein